MTHQPPGGNKLPTLLPTGPSLATVRHTNLDYDNS